MGLGVKAVGEDDEYRIGIGEWDRSAHNICKGKVEIELSSVYQRKVIMSC